VVEQDQIPGAIEQEDSEVRPANPRAVVGDYDPPQPGSSPPPTPPGHLNIGPDSFLGSDPVTGSVMMDDWGPVPGGDPDTPPGAVSVLDEDATS
jgi:hypothetical protein